MKTLKISKEISLPIDIVTQTVAILAKRRAGKSYTMRKLTEELIKADQQIVIVDPKGDQWGIRSSSDGKKPGFPIVILGGEHGDAPLEPSAGEVVAKLVVEERVSILLDLSVFRKHEIATFMAIFLETLYRLKAQEAYRTPVMLIIDEADAIAPQKPQKGEERMLGAAEDIVRRGGQRGIGCALITQRSAVLNKNVLTQAQMLIVLRTIAPQDLAAMKAWIDVHGSIEEGKMLMESLPSLPIGDAWFWSPGWPTEEGIFARSHVLPIETFDSGATPKPGEKKVVPKNLADVDLDALKKQMAATIEKAKGDDPKLLKKKIAELEQMNTSLLRHPFQKDLTKEQIEEIVTPFRKIKNEQITKMMQQYFEFVQGWLKQVEALDSSMREWVLKDLPLMSEGYKKVEDQILKMSAKSDFSQKNTKSVLVHSDGIPLFNSNHRLEEEIKKFGRCSKAIYSYLCVSEPKTKTQIAIAIGYSRNSGGFTNSISELSSSRLIDRQGDKLSANPPGRSDLIIDIDTSLEKWSAKLGACSRAIWQMLLNHERTQSWSKDTIAEKTGYSITSGGFTNSISELAALGLIVRVERGTVMINPEILNL